MALCILRYFIIMLFINNDIIVDTILVGSQNEEANLQKNKQGSQKLLGNGNSSGSAWCRCLDGGKEIL